MKFRSSLDNVAEIHAKYSGFVDQVSFPAWINVRKNFFWAAAAGECLQVAQDLADNAAATCGEDGLAWSRGCACLAHYRMPVQAVPEAVAQSYRLMRFFAARDIPTAGG